MYVRVCVYVLFHDEKVYTVPVAEIEAHEGTVALLPVPPQNTDPTVATRLELNPSQMESADLFERFLVAFEQFSVYF